MLHEIGHALAMKSRGVKFDEIGLGLPFPLIPKLEFKMPFANKFCVHPLLLGAYVKPSQGENEKMDNFSYADQSLIFGAGILMNVALGTFYYLIGGMLATTNISHFLTQDVTIVVLAATLFILLGRSIFTKYCIPVLGLGMLILVTFSISSSANEVVGPVGLIKMAHSLAQDLAKDFLFASTVSWSLALMNMIPVHPLDGGKIVSAMMGKKFPRIRKTYEIAGGLIFLVFIAFVILHDLR